MQGLEVGNPVDAKDHGLTVDHELLLPDLKRGLDNPRKTVCPVVTVPGDQPHAGSVALHAKPVTVIFDFVDPIGPIGNLGPTSGNANGRLHFISRSTGKLLGDLSPAWWRDSC
jgi:hypothetical protein